MKKVIIASKNPVKIQAVKNGLSKMFPKQAFECTGVAVPSGVPDQPFSDAETFRGAKNRADHASAKIPGADFYVGIEGGIELIDNEMQAFAWVLIKAQGRYGKSKTSTFFLPGRVVELVKAGKELGEADDIVFNRENSKQKAGAVGILTGEVINRSTYYTEAVILALIPFKNKDLYE